MNLDEIAADEFLALGNKVVAVIEEAISNNSDLERFKDPLSEFNMGESFIQSHSEIGIPNSYFLTEDAVLYFSKTHTLKWSFKGKDLFLL